MPSRIPAYGLITIAIVALAAASAPAPSAQARSVPRPLIAFSGNPPGDTLRQLTIEYKRLRAMGVTAVRMEFNWGSVEPYGKLLGDYNWTATDTHVRAARSAGLGIIGLLDYGQPNYSAAGGAAAAAGQQGSGSFGAGDPNNYPPDNPNSFATFASAVASRYGRKVTAWEVWNEENEGWRFWLPKEDPAAYARLLCAADRSLKRVTPRVPVAFGGVFIPPLNGALGTGGVKFVDEALRAGGRAEIRCFDAIAFHPYPYPFTSPEAVVADRGSVIGAAAALRSVLTKRHVPATVPLWNTEIGWPTNPAGNGVTEATQARYTARTMLLSWKSGVPVISWYEEYDHTDPSKTNQEAHFGFFDAGGAPKPAYRALATLDSLIGAPGWYFTADRSRALHLPRGNHGIGQGFALEFSASGGRRLLALWYANEQPPAGPSFLAPVTPGTPPKSITVRLALPRGAVVRSMYGRRMTAETKLQVGQAPIYVAWLSRASRHSADG